MNTDKVKRELAEVLNRNSVDNELGTPDFILANYLYAQLEAYGIIKDHNMQWHSKEKFNTVLDSPAPQDEEYDHVGRFVPAPMFTKPIEVLANQVADEIEEATRKLQVVEKPKDIKDEIIEEIHADVPYYSPTPFGKEQYRKAMDIYLSRKKQELIERVRHSIDIQSVALITEIINEL